MNTTLKTVTAAALGLAIVGFDFVAKSVAACVPLPNTNSKQRQEQFVRAGLLSDPIVGFWKAQWISQDSTGIPDGTVIDSPFVQWHDDNTEIINSTRVPATGNFCLGVWRTTAPQAIR